jgi:hypothetical protein
MKAKKIIISTTVACFLIAIASFTFYSCKKKPFDDIAQIAESNFTTATIGVQFVDASSGEPVGWVDATQDVTLTIIGSDANKIVTVSNGTDFKTSKGFLSLALAEGVTATSDNPVKFMIVAKAEGFITTTFPISVRNQGGINVKIPMVSITNGLSGVAIKIDKTSLGASEASAASGTTTTISISSGAATSGSDATTATIDIPAGQKFYTDATHSERVTEALEISFAKFSATESASLIAFPGTLDAQLNNNSEGKFTTLGLINLEMKTASGKEVTSFEKPITVTTGIPAGIKKPDGSEVIAGDTIPVWSHSNTTGKWTYEGNCTIINNAGKLETSYTITHLSNWNIDILQNICYPGATLNFTGNITTDQAYYANLYDENGVWMSCTNNGGFKVKSGTTEKMDAGTNKNAYLLVFKTQEEMESGRYQNASVVESKAIAKSSVFNGCSGNVTINVVDPSLIVNVTVNATCGSSNQTYRPTFPVFANDVTAGAFFPSALGNVVNGKFSSSSLIVGHTYKVWVYYNGDIKTKDVIIDSHDVTIDLALSDNACAALKIK